MSRTVGASVMKAMGRSVPSALGAEHGEALVNPGQQQCPGVAGGAARGRVGGGLGGVGGGRGHCSRR